LDKRKLYDEIKFGIVMDKIVELGHYESCDEEKYKDFRNKIKE
jgi:hypothetical protein